MKIRKHLAYLKQELLTEITNKMDDHHCEDFHEEGMSCIICCLVLLKKPLALLQFLRAKKYWKTATLSNETKLIELLGEQEFKLRTKDEVKIVRNTPKKRCFSCGRVVTLWMPYSSAALYVHVFKQGKLKVDCSSCGEKVLFSREELKFKNHKKIVNQQALHYAISLANKFNYNTDENDEPEYFEPDMDEGDEEEE